MGPDRSLRQHHPLEDRAARRGPGPAKRCPRADRPHPLQHLPLPRRRHQRRRDQLRRRSDLHDDARAPHDPGAAVTAGARGPGRASTREVNPNGADTTVALRIRRRCGLPAERLGANATGLDVPMPASAMSKHFQNAQHVDRRARAGHPLPLPRGRHQRSRQRQSPRTAPSAPSRSPVLQRSLPQRPRPPADRRRAAARLPRLRARLGRQHRRLRRRVQPGRRADPVRRLPAGREPRAASSTASTTAASPAPATRPTTASTPTSRPAAKTAGRPNTSASRPTDPVDGPFASTLAEADAGLDTFAFGGPEICSPCFADGSDRHPVHLPDGELVQGMAGSITRARAPNPAGYIGKHLSADGSHFVFGSTSHSSPTATTTATSRSMTAT